MSYAKGWHFDSSAKVNGLCPACNCTDKPKRGVLKKKIGKFGKFLGCSRYPECQFVKNLGKYNPDQN